MNHTINIRYIIYVCRLTTPSADTYTSWLFIVYIFNYEHSLQLQSRNMLNIKYAYINDTGE